jgi:Zn-dependent M16 (insulinase) family peptidase
VKDYENLLSVYLDATYFPLLKDQDFLQEGWRLEREQLQDPKSAYQLKGVVLNEMKDVYGSESDIFVMNLVHYLMPDTIYVNEFGGHPFNIPELDNSQVKQFHQTHYHPSNAKFFTYGDQPLEFYLSRIDPVLQKFKSSPKYRELSSIESQKKWSQEKNVEITCPPELFGSNLESGKQVTTSVTYLLTEVTDQFETFVLQLLSTLLTSGQNSPFYDSLIASGLGKSFSPATGFSDWTKQTFFSVGLKGIGEDQIESIHQLIQETFEKAEKDGIPNKQVEAVLHSIELAAKHQTASFGLNLIRALNSVWNHDGDAMEALQLNKNIQRFRDELVKNPRFLSDKIDQYFIRNTHRLKLTMRPKDDYVDEFKLKQEDILKQKLSSLSEEDLKKNDELCVELNKTMSNNKDASVLPCLQVESDIPRNLPQKTVVEHVSICGGQARVQVAAQNTNQVTYFRALSQIDLKNIPADLLEQLPLFCSVFGELGAGDLDRKEMSHEIDMNCVGLDASLQFRSNLQNGHDFELFVLFNTYCLNDRLERTLELLSKKFNDLHIDDPSHIGQLIKMYSSMYTNSVVSSGHSYACVRSARGLTPVNSLQERFQGISYISLLSKLAEQSEFDQTISKLKRLSKIIFDRNNLQFALNTEPLNVKSNLKLYENFYNTLPTSSSAPASSSVVDFNDLSSGQLEHYVMPFNSNYVSKSMTAVPYLHADFAKYKVLCKLLSRKYLHPEIREKGSAYGSGLDISSNGVLSFFSYRDPNLQRTIDIMDKSFNWASNANNFSVQDVNEAKISIFKELDLPSMPGNHGVGTFISGINDSMRQQNRDNVFAVEKNELVQFVQKIQSQGFTKIGTAVLGPESEQTKNGKWVHLKD